MTSPIGFALSARWPQASLDVRLTGVAASTDGLDLAPYTGRWIAIVRGRVAGVGLSPEEACRLAKHNRPREEAVIVFVSSEGEARGQRVTRNEE